MEPPKPTTIRVIETRRSLLNPLTASQEEISQATTSILEANPELAEKIAGTPAEAEKLLNSLSQISARLQPISYFIEDPGTQASHSIAVRALLANPAIYPIIIARGAAAERDDHKEGVYTRPAERHVAIMEGKKVSISSEEPIVVIGFAVDEKRAGSVITFPRSLAELAASGSYSPADFAAAGGTQRPPENLSVKRSNKVTKAGPDPPATPDRIDKIAGRLAAQTRAAVSYYLSGAAASLGSAAILAAAQGEGGADSEIAAAFRANLESEIISSEVIPARPWRSEDATSRLLYFLGRLEKITGEKLTDQGEYDLSPLTELFRVGASGVYLHVLTEGRESAQVDEFLEKTAIKRAKETQLNSMRLEAAQAQVTVGLYLLIIKDKLGSARWAAVSALIKGAETPAGVLKHLTKNEREIVKTEHENRIAEWQAMAANNCPHVPLVRRLRRAATASDALKALKELEHYIVNKTGKDSSEWLKCKNCSYRIICPHVRDRVQLEAARASYGQIRSQLMKYAAGIAASGAGGVVVGATRTYFCRICSERLADVAERDEGRAAANLGRFGELDSELRKKVWLFAMRVAQDVKFPVPTDEKRFATFVEASVYPLLLAAEASEKKGRRRQADSELGPRVLLRAAVFVYAFVLDLIQRTRGTDAAVGFADARPGGRASVYAEALLRHLTNAHRGVISQIEDITPEYIKELFTDAYRLVHSAAAGDMLQPLSPEEELALYSVMADPVYRYASLAARVAKDLAQKATAKIEFETVYGGRSLTSIIKEARESLRNPQIAPLLQQRAGLLVPSWAESLEAAMKDPRINLHSRLYKIPAPDRKDLDALYGSDAGGPAPKGKVKGGARASGFRRPANQHEAAERALFYESYRLFSEYAKTGMAGGLADSLAKLRAAEITLKQKKKDAGFFDIYDYGFANQREDLPVVSLGAIYDEEGRRHDWGQKTTYIFQKADNSELVLKGVAAVKKARESGELTGDDKLVDLLCPVCGLRESEARKLDTNVVRAAVMANTKIGTFFDYFESRCPAGDLHKWAGGKCEKCGLLTGLRDSVKKKEFTREARDYYNKYAEVYDKERAARPAPAVAPTPPASKTHDKAATDWNADYTFVVRAAGLAGVTPALIEAIGSVEGRDYQDVTEGRNAPPPPMSTHDPRLMAVDAEVRFFFTKYSQLRNVGRFPETPPGLEALLAEAGAPAHELANLPSLMPEVGEAEYYGMFEAMCRLRTPAEVAIFAIEYLCRAVLTVSATQGPAWVARLGELFAKKELAAVLRGQQLMAKPGVFNWALFEGMSDDPDLETFVETEEDYVEEGDAGGDAITGDIDYDTSEANPNNEPS